MKNIILNLLATVGCFSVAVGLMNGTVQNHIAFADPLNEMAMCVVALMLGVGFMFAAASDIKDKMSAGDANS